MAWKHNVLVFIAVIVSIAAYGGGLYGVGHYLVTKQSPQTYMSEHALLAGHADHTWRESHSHVTVGLAQSYRALQLRWLDDDAGAAASSSPAPLTDQAKALQLAEWIAGVLQSFGAKAYIHTFEVPATYTARHQHSTSQQHARNQVEIGYNVYGVLPARGDATEALICYSRYQAAHPDELTNSYIGGVPFILSLLSHIQNKMWRHKEFIPLFTDGRFGHIGLKEWLTTYNTPRPNTPLFSPHLQPPLYGNYSTFFQRSGQLLAALHINFTVPPSKFIIKSQGINGQLPNLDLINTSQRNGRRTNVNLVLSTETVDQLLPPALKNAIPSRHLNMYNFALELAAGVPTSDHGLFTKHRVEAITFQSEPNPRSYDDDEYRLLSQITEMGRLFEGVYRSVNGITERLHQSFYYYILPETSQYIPIGYYIPWIGPLLLPLLIKGVYLLYYAQVEERRWGYGAAIVGTVWLHSLSVLATPFILQSTHLISDITTIVHWWVGISFGILCLLYGVSLPCIRALLLSNQIPVTPTPAQTPQVEWASTAAFGLLLVALGLGPFVILNYAFCAVATILVVPVYSLVAPSRFWLLRNIQGLLVCAFSPPGLVALFAIYRYYLATAAAAPVEYPWTLFAESLATLLDQWQVYGTMTLPFACVFLMPASLTLLHLLYSSQFLWQQPQQPIKIKRD
eukprot:TRINITY_DN5879_c0_g1_i3.p1 TRINITY_DN5879_c0_g1~~TRINITY_DN5879_c0_g1_i3.p1  ORF type:complete len:681 (-),score=84.37 TRINITY_DN5879_c0_g1_i3:1-2043(-)